MISHSLASAVRGRARFTANRFVATAGDIHRSITMLMQSGMLGNVAQDALRGESVDNLIELLKAGSSMSSGMFKKRRQGLQMKMLLLHILLELSCRDKTISIKVQHGKRFAHIVSDTIFLIGSDP